VHTIRKYGPDRIAGFSPIPAMSMVSHGAGARFINLIGGTMLSFYDWYADLPVASPQVFGDQTDVPESADWWNSSYLVMWGSNVPVTRTPDAHFMTEARYHGQKVVVVSPDYADNTKFADEWLAPHPGTDGALAMAMGHVILKEFLVERRTPRFVDYLKRFSDAPYLITLDERGDAWVPGKFLTAADLGGFTARAVNAEFKTVLLTRNSEPVVPNGSLGHRFSAGDEGAWNLDLGDIDPLLSVADGGSWRGSSVAVDLPRFDVAPEPGREHEGGAGTIRRGVPVTTVEGRTVTTVYDLLLAQYGVPRESLDLPGRWPTGYDDATSPGTPAWQEEITSVPAAKAERIGREFADNAERSGGRSMILMGAGTNHWLHSDTIYRTSSHSRR
jgi:nitrate reductase alpha subunit